MKKIIVLTLTMFFFVESVDRESSRSQEENRQNNFDQSNQNQKEEIQKLPVIPKEQSEEEEETSLKKLEGFFSIFPDPNQQEFELLPDLDKIISLVYEETLDLPPIVYSSIRSLYALIQSLTLSEENISLENTSEQEKKKISSQIVQKCLNSPLWQDYNKSFIVESLEYGMSLLKSIHQEEKMIFTYIPNFETAYYSQGYTHVRNGSELVRLSMVLSDDMRDRAIKQCSWGSLKTTDLLYSEIGSYQESEFYLLAKKIKALLKSTKKYPFPKGSSLIDHNGNVSSDFNHFVYKSKNGLLTVSEYAQFIMNIDQNNHPYLTDFGNFVFNYTNNDLGPSLSKKYIFYDLFLETEHGLTLKPMFLKILALDGIRIINTHLAYLFNAANLESTMQKLALLEEKNSGILQSFPNIIPYMPYDYPYLNEIKELIVLVSENTTPQASVQSWDSFWGSVKHAFVSAGQVIKHSFEKDDANFRHAFVHLGEDIGYGIKDAGEGIAYLFAAGAIAIGDPSKAANFFEKSSNNFSKMMKHITDGIEEVGKIAEAAVTTSATIFGQVVGSVLQDKKLGADLTGLTTALTDGIINTIVKAGQSVTTYVGDSVILSSEAVFVLEDVIVAGLNGGTNGSKNGIIGVLSTFSKDIVNSLLTELTFLSGVAGSILTGIMKGVAYLCSSIVDLIGDVAGGLAELGADIHGENGLEVFNKIKSGVNEWRRSITGGIMLVAGIAITVGTLGEAGALGVTMAVMGTGMMVIGSIGDVQQDIAAHKKKKAQDAILSKYSASEPGLALSAQAMQASFMTESTVQFAAEKQNAERGLIYYQNFLNSQFNSTVSIQANSLSQFYQEITMPDTATGIPLSDPGCFYGIKTERMALNPAQGIYSFNAGRNTFAQEVATIPQQTLKTSQGNLFMMNPASTGLWINQKDLSNMWVELEVEVRFRTIYETEGDFYIGIFVSEQVMNIPLLQALRKNYKDAIDLSGDNTAPYIEKTWENLDTFNRNLLNYNALSRNLVIFRKNGAVPTVGFYQHQGEGDGWLNKNIGGVSYQRGVWYRMKISINGTTTKVKCWEESAGETDQWTTFQTPQARRLPTIEPIPLPNKKDPFELIVNEQNSSVNKNKTTQSDKSSNDTQTKKWVISGEKQKEQSEKIKNAFGSVGMISSGASVEYQIISPATKTVVMPIREKNNTIIAGDFKENEIDLIEKEREKKWLLKNGTAEPQMQYSSGQSQQNNLPKKPIPRPIAATKPEHSTLWYLQHGQSPPSQTNINSKISSSGKFAELGGPN